MFTGGQQKHYREILKKGWLLHCKNIGLDPFKNPYLGVEYNIWYRAELTNLACFDLSGKPSTALCNHNHDFTRVMHHFAGLANDRYWLLKTTSNSEDQMRYLIKQRLAEISELTGEPVGAAYERAIERHMHLAPDPSDIPVEHLDKVFQALDTHVRRLRARDLHGEVHAAAS